MLGLFWIAAGAAYVLGSGIRTIGRNGYHDAYMASKKYNPDRQWELRWLALGFEEDREKFCKILGRKVPASDLSNTRKLKEYVSEIAEREGWRYYEIGEEYKDPEYCKHMGIKKPYDLR